ncbi:hypothetical protein G7K_5428-t1 [Saitoella complicata NRRL Y-17804]|uniref:Spc7 kinetochore protein domain-containing protein n=2 Tax=Saitoella complicata (strain BCRC 22490 / CBS 7301 / JCM 7358 / NBRC 10748 / NRRL Y-17804) TaxID=698492 RepID=A0A0E9NPH0_SAICN|nr:hypothetical protein G7K_5428-t1 [Saitoella complicata NRRL Y-17804]
MSSTPRRSPRKSIAFGSAFSPKSVNKENASPQKRAAAADLLAPTPSRKKRSQSLGGADDPRAPSAAKITPGKNSRMSLAPRGILKSSAYTGEYVEELDGAGPSRRRMFDDNHTVVGVMQVALKEEAERESEEQKKKRQEKRKSLGRRVSFASFANVRLFDKDQEAQTPGQATPNKGSPKKKEAPQNSPLISFDSPAVKASPKHAKPPASPAPLITFSSDTPFDDDDEDEDADMDLAGDDMTSQFHIMNGTPVRQSTGFMIDDSEDDEEEGEATMDVTQAIGGFIKSNAPEFTDDEEEAMDEQTMDLTKAVGGFIGGQQVAEDSDEDMGDGEMTMDITGVVPPAYLLAQQNAMDEDDSDENEEMTMDVTRAVGGILNQGSRQAIAEDETIGFDMDITRAIGGIINDEKENPVRPVTPKKKAASAGILQPRPDEPVEEDGDDGMDLTVAVGGIFSRAPQVFQEGDDEDDEEESNENDGMDLTVAVGSILSNAAKEEEQRQIDAEEDNGNDGMDMTVAVGGILSTPQQVVEEGDEDDDDAGNEAMTMDITRAIGGIVPPAQSLPDDAAEAFSPIAGTPVGKARNLNVGTPLAAVTPQQKQPLGQYGTPMQFRTPMLGTPLRTPRSGIRAAEALLGRSPAPLLKDRRKSDTSAFPAVKMGSPRAVEILSRRKSIGMEPRSPAVKVVVGREAGWGNEEFGANIPVPKGIATIQDRIASMTPKKKPVIAKSPARGMTPLKLDFTAAPASPKVGAKRAIEQVNTPSPTKKKAKFDVASVSTTPVRQASLAKEAQVEVKIEDVEMTVEETATVEEPTEKNISLSNFLDMTGISFLDGLTTTRRRETIAIPQSMMKEPQDVDYIKASLVTLPMLELFQHCCKELKTSITDGQEAVKEIEQDTLEDNPLLFQEYLNAASDVRAIMDSQFKLIKTNARLKAKGVWYEWRDKLVQGVLEDMQKKMESLEQDEKTLVHAKEELTPILAQLKARHAEVKKKLENKRAKKQAIEESNQEELKKVRERITELDEEIKERRAQLEAEEKEKEEADRKLAKVEEQTADAKRRITAAEKTIEENRGLDANEIEDLKEQVTGLEQQSGWKVTLIRSNTIAIEHVEELRCHIHMKDGKTHVTLSLVDEDKANECTRFFFDHLQKTVQNDSERPVPQILAGLRKSWAVYKRIRTEFELLRVQHPVTVSRVVTEDGTAHLQAATRLLLPSARSKLSVTFAVTPAILDVYPDMNQSGAVTVKAEVIYGTLDEKEVMKSLVGRVGTGGSGALTMACKEVYDVWE